MIANPFILFDASLYVSYPGSASPISRILTDEYIEWDLVNSGGFCHVIMSFVGLAGILGTSIVVGGGYRKTATISAIAFCALTLLFIVSPHRFLGWYYLPLIFIFPLCVGKSNIYWILLAVNLLFMHSDLTYQLSSKLEQINHIDNECIIQEFIDKNYAAYSEYNKIQYVDPSMENIKFDVILYYKPEDRQFIVISDKARNNEDIQKIYESAIEKTNGYSLLSTQDDISIVIHDKDE